MLDELGLLGLKDFYDLQDSSYDTADKRFPKQGAELRMGTTTRSGTPTGTR